MLCVLAILNACTLITRFTRVAGELFSMLILVLFTQEAIKVHADALVNVLTFLLRDNSFSVILCWIF